MSLEIDSVSQARAAGKDVLLAGLLPAGKGNVEQLVFRLPGSVDLDTLRKAWQRTIARHPGLARDGVQRNPTGDGSRGFEHIDHSGLEHADERAAQLDAILRADRERVFDPARSPLLRLTVVSEREGCQVVLSICHGLLDWRSLSTLLREAINEYQQIARGEAGGEVSALLAAGKPEPGAPFRGSIDEAFWKEYLVHFEGPHSLDLPTAVSSVRHDKDRLPVLETVLDKSEGDSVRRLRKAAGVTLNNLVQAAWALLHAHYSGSRDVVFGITRSCRRSAPPGHEDSVGPFTNVLPMRMTVKPEQNVFELLWQARDQYRQVRAHECDPLVLIEECVTLRQGQRLFDSVVEFDLRDPVQAMRELFPEDGPQDFRHFAGAWSDLDLQVYGEDEMIIRLKYNKDRFSEEVAQQLLSHFTRLLIAMAREPWMPALDVPYLDDEESTPCRWPGAQRLGIAGKAATLHGRFRDQALATPDAVAVSCGDNTLTYAELEERSTRLAARLAERLEERTAEQGTSGDRLVGLCMDRSIDQVVGLLAILKAGAGYLPLDPDYPEERLQFLLQDSGTALVVTTSATRDRLAGADVEFIDPVEGADTATLPANVHADPDSLAYVIYTSGSTGQPKGVQVTHGNVTRLFDVSQSWLEPGIGDVWTMFHSFAFDFSVWEIWGALLHGGRLEVVPKETARSPEAFHALLVERGVTVLNQTPSAFSQLMKVDAQSTRKADSLRFVIFGGEQLDVAGLLPWFERHGDEKPRLVNMYGITETTVHVTYRPLSRKDAEMLAAPGAGKSGSPIGVPLPDLYVRLLDSEGRHVPPGVPGEICVGGAGVTRGYLNRPGLNARHFIVDPHDKGMRLYRSGDFARRMPNGELAYLGRRDDQVKIRGFRIDLGEIGNTVKRLPGVDDGIAVMREAQQGDRRLVVYYVARDSALGEARLRDMLREKLPAHMMPAALIRIDRIPMNANNKVDYKALPGIADSGAGVAADQKPANATEAVLAKAWSEVLERSAVGRNDDFFGLGGDSITALQVIARAREEGVEVSPRDIFNHSRLDALARVARHVHTDEKAAPIMAEGKCELTPAQRAFFERNLERPDHCNQAFLFRLPPDCEIDNVERAFQAVVAHHDALRLRFSENDVGEMQGEYVEPHEAFEFSRVELDHLEAEERREAIRLITRDIQSSLSLRSGVLMRAAHFTGGLEDGDRLLIVVHQLAMDTASWGILLQDLDAAYRELSQDREPALFGTTAFRDWTARLSRHARSQRIAGELPYWQKVMEAPPGDLWDGNDPGREGGAETISIRFDAPETAALLTGVHAAYGTDVNELLLAGIARACTEQWFGCDRLRIDVLQNGREHDFKDIDISRTIGWFNHLQPLVLDLSRARQFARGICDIKNSLRGTANHGTGYGLLRALHPGGRKELRRAEPARILFAFSGRYEKLLDTGIFKHANEDTGAWSAPENRLSHQLAINGVVHDDRLELHFRFDAERLPSDSITQFAERCRRALQALVKHCSTRDRASRTPEDFPLARLTQAELDSFPIALERAEDILPLTPLQRLFHALDGTSSDVGFDQWVFNLEGSIDERAFEEAWRELFRRHDALRTVVVDRGLHEPHQVVLRDIEFNLQKTDMRLLSEGEQQRRISEFLEADRKEGFNLSVAPLTRVTLFRLDAKRWTLVWSHWQAQVDGWSWPILSAELGELHDTIRGDRQAELKPPGSYRSYVAWLMERNLDEYAGFWRDYLGHGARSRSLISKTRRKGDGQRNIGPITHKRVELAADLSGNIQRLSRQLKLTPSVIFQAAWALVTAGMTSRFEVTLGAAFSGRTAGIPIDDNTVGPFLNDLPVRFRIAPVEQIDNWLSSLRSMQADLNHYQNVSPTEVHRWAGKRGTARLFDTLLVFQNYATGNATQRWGRRIRVESFKAGVRTNYPVSIAITPGDRFCLDFYYATNVVDADTIKRATRHLVTVLNVMAQHPDIRIETILKHISEQRSDTADTGERNRRATDRQTVSPEQTQAGEYAPRNGGSMEAQIAETCREVLDLPNIRLNENFFDLGAQSVSLIEIHALLQERLERNFPIVKLFEHPTVHALAGYLQQGDREDDLRELSRRSAARRAALNRRRQSYHTGRQES